MKRSKIFELNILPRYKQAKIQRFPFTSNNQLEVMVEKLLHRNKYEIALKISLTRNEQQEELSLAQCCGAHEFYRIGDCICCRGSPIQKVNMTQLQWSQKKPRLTPLYLDEVRFQLNFLQMVTTLYQYLIFPANLKCLLIPYIYLGPLPDSFQSS